MLNETSANGFHASEKPAPKKLKTQIVVVGGGAGGLELVRKLGTYYGREDFDIILDAIAQVKGDRINNTILLGTEAQDRVRATILMIMATPEYMIQK